MRWIDLSEHGLSLWLGDERSPFVLSSITDDALPAYALEFVQGHGGDVSEDNRKAYFNTRAARDLLASFPGARVRWLTSDDAVERPQDALRANWLFTPQSPDPAALHLSPGFSLPEWVSVVALSENDAASLGSLQIEVIPARQFTSLVPHHVINNLFYGVDEKRFPGMTIEPDDIPHAEMNAQPDDGAVAQSVAEKVTEDRFDDDGRFEIYRDGNGDIAEDVEDVAVDDAASVLIDDFGDDTGNDAGRREDYGRVIPWARKHVFQLYSQDDGNDTKALVGRLRTVNLEFLWNKKERKAIQRSPHLLNIITQDVIVGMMSPSAMDGLLVKKHAPIGRNVGMKHLNYGNPALLVTGCISHATAILQTRRFFESTANSPSMVRQLAVGFFNDALNIHGANEYSKKAIFGFSHRGVAWTKKMPWFTEPMFPLAAPANNVHECYRDEADARENAAALIPKNGDGTVDFERATDEVSEIRTVHDALSQIAMFNVERLNRGDVSRVLSIPYFVGKEVIQKAKNLISLVDDHEKRVYTSEKLDNLAGWFYDQVREKFINESVFDDVTAGYLTDELKKELEKVNTNMDVANDFKLKIIGRINYAVDNLDDLMQRVDSLFASNDLDFGAFLRDGGAKKTKPAENQQSKEPKEKIELAASIVLPESPINIPDDVILERRGGIDWRLGQNVGEQSLCERFGFSGIQYGNYVPQSERQSMLNECFDALADMAYTLGINDRFMGLDGKLALAFGARGRGGRRAHAAHFEPGQEVINFTRKKGRGTLAHELAHGWDNFFGKNRGTLFLSEMKHNPYGDNNDSLHRAIQGFMNDLRSVGVADHKQLNELRKQSLNERLWLARTEFLRDITQDSLLAATELWYCSSRTTEEKVAFPAEQYLPGARAMIAAVAESFIRFAADKKSGDFFYSGKNDIPTYSASKISKEVEALSKDSFNFVDDKPNVVRSSLNVRLFEVYASAEKLFYKSLVKYWRKENELMYHRHSDSSVFLNNAITLDEGRNKPYWVTGRELFARGFSSVMHGAMTEAGVCNDFATKISEPGIFPHPRYRASPNLEGAEYERMRDAFTNGLALDIKRFSDNWLGERNEAARTPSDSLSRGGS